MNYKNLHEQIITRAQSRNWTKKCAPVYTENHHIVPVCMNGTNSKENLVLLTAREHFLIHWLLYKIHGTSKLAFAWHAFGAISKNQHRYTSHSYAYAQLAQAKHNSIREVSEETREKYRQNMLGSVWPEERKQRLVVSLKKLRWITNGLENKRVHKDDPIPLGWWNSMTQSQDHINKVIKTQQNKMYITDGCKNKRVEKNSIIPEGWRRGMTKKTTSNKGTIWINNGLKNRRIYPNQTIPYGFKKGWLSCKK